MHIIKDQFRSLKSSYRVPKYPIVLCHGLLGSPSFYWRGISDELSKRGASVVVDAVPPAGTIYSRAKALSDILDRHPGPVNLIGHSMGGLDARLLAHVWKGKERVKSVTTVGTPHHGSPIADSFLQLTNFLPPSLGGFAQLSGEYLRKFNGVVRDDPNVAYFSYGARFKPNWVSVFRIPWAQIYRLEGDNDGMVSVKSSQWGHFEGIIENCDHLDLINLTWLKPVYLVNKDFSAAALYLHVMDELAGHGF